MLARIRFGVLLLLIILAPFHAFLVSWLEPGAVLSAWREILVIVVGGLVVIEMIREKRWPKFDFLDWTILGYLGLCLVWLVFQRHDLFRWALGVRFDLLPFLFYLLLKQATWEVGQKNILVRAVLVSGALVVVFGLLHAVVLPQNFLTHFGYAPYEGTYTVESGVAACQFLEHSSAVCRATSTFGGPTRYGTYLLLLAGVLLPFLKDARGKWRVLFAVFFALIVANIFLTYSRSVWIGALTTGVVGGIFLMGKKWSRRRVARWIVGILVGVIAITSLSFLIVPKVAPQFSQEISQKIHDVVVRTSSSSEHYYMARQGLITAIEHPLGLGLGMSGPATYYFKKSLTENAYLQIALELGVPGLILFMGILFLLGQRLLRKKNPLGLGLFLSLVGIAVTGLFTHSFEETTTMLLLCGLAGSFSEAP